MLRAILNLPLDVKAIRLLVADDNDLKLMMPSATLPFSETEWASKMDASKGTLSFLVKQNTQVIGHFAFLRINQNPGELALGLVYLELSKRGTGISTKLIELAEKTAFEFLDTKAILLNVMEFNTPASRLYLKLGYKEYERNAGVIRMKKAIQ